MKKKAFITGVSGQDGSYLAELLLSKNYDVYAIYRRNSVAEQQSTRIEHIRHEMFTFYGDMLDFTTLFSIFRDNQFDEVYNLGAQSHVQVSYAEPLYTNQVNYIGYLNLLEIIRATQDLEKTKIYQASSSEMFGNTIDDDGFQRETTPMNPVSPYGVSKLASYQIGRNYRRAYGMQIYNGILFNHESVRRTSNFVTAKIAKAVARIHLGKQENIQMGNLDSCRDWGCAIDYVKVMWQILNESGAPDDYVCATGVARSVRDVLQVAFEYFQIKDWEDKVVVNQKFVRPEDLVYLKGDASKLKKAISFKPEHTFRGMIEEMCNYWYNELRAQKR